MPIPMSNERPQVQAPRAARGEALNLTREADQGAQIAAHRGQLIDNSIKASVDAANQAFQLKNQLRDADELQRLSDAWLVYSAGMEQENARVANMKDAEFRLDRQNKKGGYDVNVTKMYQKMQDVINTTQNKELANQFQDKVNELNVNNARQLAIKTDAARRDEQISTADAMVTDTIQRGVANDPVFDASDKDIKDNAWQGQITSSFLNKSKDIEKQLFNKYWAQGIRNPKVVEVELRKRNEELATQVINRLNQTNPSNQAWEESLPGQQFLQYLHDNGYVSEAYANKEFNRMESETVAEEVMYRPEQFVDKNTGAFKFSDRLKNAPHMTHYEYDRLIQNAESIAKDIKGKALKNLGLKLLDKATAEDVNFTHDMGMESPQYISGLAKSLNMTPKELREREDMKDFFDAYDTALKKNRKKNQWRPDIFFDRAEAIDAIMQTPVLYNSKTGQVVMSEMTEEQAKRYAKDPNAIAQGLTVVRPLQNAKELQDRKDFYENMGQFLAAGFDPKKTKQIGRTWGEASKAPASAVLYSEIWSTMKQAEKATGKLPISTMGNIYRTASQMLTSGVTLPSEYTVNGKQISRKLYMNMDSEINYKNKANLETLREAAAIAIAKNLPRQTSAAILEAMNQRDLERAEKQWNGKRDMGTSTAFDERYYEAMEAMDKVPGVNPYIGGKLLRGVNPYSDFAALYSVGRNSWDWLFSKEAEMPTQAQDVFEQLISDDMQVLIEGLPAENREKIQKMIAEKNISK